MRHQFDRQVRDKWKADIVIGDQTGKRVFANDASGVRRMVELFGKVHGQI